MKRKLFFASIFFLPVLFCIISCWRNPAFDQHRLTTEELLKRDNYILPDSLFCFFPSDSLLNSTLENITIVQNANRTLDLGIGEFIDFYPYQVVELYKVKNRDSAKQIYSSVLPLAKSIVAAEDSSYSVVISSSYLYNKFKLLSFSDLYKGKSLDIVIPYFDYIEDLSIIGDTSTICGLRTGTQIITLMQGDQCLISPEYRFEKETLPSSIRHGYRCGIAINIESCSILYWAMAW